MIGAVTYSRTCGTRGNRPRTTRAPIERQRSRSTDPQASPWWHAHIHHPHGSFINPSTHSSERGARAMWSRSGVRWLVRARVREWVRTIVAARRTTRRRPWECEGARGSASVWSQPIYYEDQEVARRVLIAPAVDRCHDWLIDRLMARMNAGMQSMISVLPPRAREREREPLNNHTHTVSLSIKLAIDRSVSLSRGRASVRERDRRAAAAATRRTSERSKSPPKLSRHSPGFLLYPVSSSSSPPPLQRVLWARPWYCGVTGAHYLSGLVTGHVVGERKASEWCRERERE